MRRYRVENAIRWSLGVVLLAVLGAVGTAQELRLYAEPNPVALDDIASLRVDLFGGPFRKVSLPEIDAPDFAVEPLRPLTGQRVGDRWRWRFQLVPIRATEDASIRVSLVADGHLVRGTLKIPILGPEPERASAEAAPAPASTSDLTGHRFVRADVDRTEVFVHEQVTYRFRYYFENWLPTREEVQYGLPPFRGFYSKPLRQIAAMERPKETIGGRSYYVEEIDVALIPLTEGRWEIGPTRLVLPPVAGKPSRELRTEPVVVRVKPLPKPIPSDFTGGVGDFTVRVEMPTSRATVGESLRLRVIVSGRGHLPTLTSLPKPEAVGGTVYDPNVTDLVDELDGRIGGTRTYEYVVVPQEEGMLEVRVPGFSVFSPTRGTYRRFEGRRLRVTVEPRSEPSPKPSSEAVSTEIRRLDRLLVLVSIVVVLSLGGWFAGRRIVARTRQEGGGSDRKRPHARSSRPSANAVAERIGEIEIGDGRRLCREIGHALIDYGTAHFDLPEGTTAIGEIADRFEAVGSPEAARMKAVLLRCAEGEFAPITLTEAEQRALREEAARAVLAFEKSVDGNPSD